MVDVGDTLGTVKKTSGRLFDEKGNNRFVFSTCGDTLPESFNKACVAYFGPEWTYAGNFDEDDWCSGVFIERFPHCKKISYEGDTDKCCIEGSDSRNSLLFNLKIHAYDNPITCDPKFDGSARRIPRSCAPSLESHCTSNGTKLWDLSIQRCKEYSIQNREDQKVINGVTAACSGSNPPAWCKDWFADPDNHGLYDAAVSAYCNRAKTRPGFNIDDEPLCYCVLAPEIVDEKSLSAGPFAYDPICFAATKCINDKAYKTKSNLVARKTCPVTLCVANVDTVNQSGSTNIGGKIIVKQNCGGPSIGTGVGTGGVEEPTMPTLDPRIIMFLVFLFTILLGAGVVIVRRLARRRHGGRSDGGQSHGGRSDTVRSFQSIH